MPNKRAGSRHVLLYYRRTMDRVWKMTFLLGVIVSIVGGFALIHPTTILGLNSDFWLLILAVLSFGLSAFAFLSRFFAYVQPRDTYLAVYTPLLHFRIGYQRIRSVRPMLIQQLFPPGKLSWSQKSYISTFYGKTVLIVDVHTFPVDPALLRLFLPDVMFSPTSPGLVLLVPDWMAFSTDLDSMMGAWRQNQGRGRLGHAVR